MWAFSVKVPFLLCFELSTNDYCHYESPSGRTFLKLFVALAARLCILLILERDKIL